MDRNLGVVVRRPSKHPSTRLPAPVVALTLKFALHRNSWHSLLTTLPRKKKVVELETRNVELREENERLWANLHAMEGDYDQLRAYVRAHAPGLIPDSESGSASQSGTYPHCCLRKRGGGQCFLFLFFRFHFGFFSSFKRAPLTRYTRTPTCSNTVHSSPASSASQSADSSPASSPGDVTRATMASLVATPVPGEGTPVGSVMDDLRGLLSYMHGGNGTGSRTAPCGWLSQSDRGRGGGRKRSWSPVVGVIASLL